MSKDSIKVIAVVLAVVLILVGINHYQDYVRETATRDEVEQEYSRSQQNGYTVYVSRNGKIHKNSSCSGMKYYTKMGYYDAIERGYEKCMNCY